MGDRYDRRRRRLALEPGNPPALAAFLFDPDFATGVPPFGMGHNNGPPLESPDWIGYCWRKAHERAWKTPPIEVIRLRLKRARELGMTYREYTVIVMDKGVYL